MNAAARMDRPRLSSTVRDIPVTIKTLRRRLDRIESDRLGKQPVLMIWDDGDDPDIELQAEKAERDVRQVMVLRWQTKAALAEQKAIKQLIVDAAALSRAVLDAAD